MAPGITEADDKESSPKKSLGPVGAEKCKALPIGLVLATLHNRVCYTDMIQSVPPTLIAG